MRNKSIFEAVIKTRPLTHKYRAYFIYMIILVVCLLLAVIYRLFTGHSFLVHFFRKVPQALDILTSIRSMISSSSIIEVSKAIGFSSVLMGWIYSSLDKEELGLKYRYLLEFHYRHYGFFVILHIASVLICLWLAHVEYIESACIGIIILLSGLILQWRVLSNIVLFSTKREETAVNAWVFLAKTATENNSDEQQFELLEQMAKAISERGIKRCHKIEDAFAIHLLCFANKPCSTIENWAMTIQHVHVLFDCLFSNIEKRTRLFIAGNIFAKLDNAIKEKYVLEHCKCPEALPYLSISVSYILWLHNHFYGKIAKEATTSEKENILSSIVNEFSAVRLHMNGLLNQRFIDYNYSATVVFAWEYFMLGAIGFVDLLGKQCAMEENTRPVFEAMIHKAFSELSNSPAVVDTDLNHAFEIAFEQIKRD